MGPVFAHLHILHSSMHCPVGCGDTIPAMSALGGLMQEDQEFAVILDYIIRSYETTITKTLMTSFCFNSLFYSVWKRVSKKHSGIIEIFMNLWFPILFPFHNWMTFISTITSMNGMKFIYYMLPINIQHMNDSRNDTQFTIHSAGIEWKTLQKRMSFKEHCYNILKYPWSVNLFQTLYKCFHQKGTK